MLKKERLMHNLRYFAEVGATESEGITRLAFSNDLFLSAEKLVEIISSMDKCIRYMDKTGSLHVILPAEKDTKEEIVFGSHFDTVPNGGLYDGSAGIAAGIEVMLHVLEECKSLKHNLHLIAFNAEEAGPLGGTYASRAMLGDISYNIDTIEVFEKKREQSELLSNVDYMEWDSSSAKAFLELHIEQGGILDAEGLDAGVVTGIFGIRRYVINIEGESNHAGTTPMNQRRDPMVAAAGLVTFINEKAKAYEGKLVATVGKLEVKPNLESIIPQKVELVMEVRSLYNDAMDELYNAVCLYGSNIDGINFASKLKVDKPPIMLNNSICDAEEKACEICKIKYKRMPSGAGHDAKSFAKAGVPTGMIFVPSIDGKSHTPLEYTTDEQLIIGAEILYETIKLIDNY